MNFGLCCMSKTLGKDGSFRTMTRTQYLKLLSQDPTNAIKELKSRTLTNLSNTYKILEFCVSNNINVYRFSSDLIPLATLQTEWDWANDSDVLELCGKIKSYISASNIRCSTHPDQFTLINSPREEVFQSSLKDLVYHNTLCELLGFDTILLHVGGAYGDKSLAMLRFEESFYRLPKQIQNKIHLENDDKSFNIVDVLTLCQKLNIPMVLDVHHHRCNTGGYVIEEYVDMIFDTWGSKKPKIHMSSGKGKVDDRSHADYITYDDIVYAIGLIMLSGRYVNDVDIMVEAKEKDLAIFQMRGFLPK